jgi:hypothetical protein
MATLAGFDEVGGQNGETNADIAAGPAVLEEDPVELQTKQPFHRSPLAKLVLVGSGTSVAMLLVSSLINNPFGHQAKAPQSPNLDPKTEATPSDQRPNGKVLTALALSEQEQQLRALNLRKQPLPKPVKQPPKPLPPRPAPVVQRSAPLPVPQLPPPSRPISRPPVTPRPAKAPVDPMKAWLMASQMGTYGSVPPAEDGSKSQRTQSGSGRSQGQASIPAINPDEEAPILTGQKRQPPKTLITGTRAKGVLATPVAWEAGSAGQKNGKGGSEERFLVTLREPLQASDGSVAFPAGTELITKMNSFSQGGLIELSVVAGIVENNGQRQEIALPQGAILVRGGEGKPLLAKQVRGSNGPSPILQALGQFALGATRQAAEQYTRSSSTVISSGGSTTVATDNPEPNLLAGALQGGADVLLDSASQSLLGQSRQASTSIWVAKADTPVEVFVNQSVPVTSQMTPSSEASSAAVSAPTTGSGQLPPVPLPPPVSSDSLEQLSIEKIQRQSRPQPTNLPSGGSETVSAPVTGASRQPTPVRNAPPSVPSNVSEQLSIEQMIRDAQPQPLAPLKDSKAVSSPTASATQQPLTPNDTPSAVPSSYPEQLSIEQMIRDTQPQPESLSPTGGSEVVSTPAAGSNQQPVAPGDAPSPVTAGSGEQLPVEQIIQDAQPQSEPPSTAGDSAAISSSAVEVTQLPPTSNYSPASVSVAPVDQLSIEQMIRDSRSTTEQNLSLPNPVEFSNESQNTADSSDLEQSQDLIGN